MQDKVARLRQLMSEALPKDTGHRSAEADASRAFRLYEFNSAPPLVVEQTPRARIERDIDRIAAWYGWHGEVARALDSAAVSTVGALTDGDLERLQCRMRQLEECVKEGLDCPDAPPAR